MNNSLLRLVKRLTTVLAVPVILLAHVLLLPLSVFIWLLTGKDVDDQMEWLDDRSGDYWAWVKGAI